MAKSVFKSYCRFLSTTLMVLPGLFAYNTPYAQPVNAVYASTQNNGFTTPVTSGGGSVTDPDKVRSVTGNIKPNDNAAVLKAWSTTGTYESYIHVKFSSLISAFSTAPVTLYIRISVVATENIDSLLGGEIVLQAYNNSTGSTVSPINTPPFSVFHMADGTLFLAVTLRASFQGLRITLKSPAASGTNEVKVYYCFYGPAASSSVNPYPLNRADCGRPWTAAAGTSGISDGSFGVAAPASAFDADPAYNTGSSFFATGLSLLGGQVFQEFYFSGPSNVGDGIKMVLSRNPDLAAVKLGTSVTLQAYLGSVAVGEVMRLQALLDIDLLGLSSLFGISGGKAIVAVVPKDINGDPVIFDRIKVDLDIGLLGEDLGSNGLNIFDVERIPAVATVIPTSVSICSNGTATLVAGSSQSGLPGIGSLNYTWYSTLTGGAALYTGAGFAVSNLNVGIHDYYVEVQKLSCAAASPRAKVRVTSQEAPDAPPVSAY